GRAGRGAEAGRRAAAEARPDAAAALGRAARAAVAAGGAAHFAPAVPRALPRRDRGAGKGLRLMAPFQIQEAGESKGKEACPPPGAAVGIDLGTTNSLVALVEASGKPRAMAVDEGSTLLPSVVHYDKDAAPIVGRAARRLAAEAPRDTIVSVKRFMG